MISEKQFALFHSGFWSQLLPMSEEYVRMKNRSLLRFAQPMESRLPPSTRGLTNEMAYRLFAAALRAGGKLRDIPNDRASEAIERAVQYVGNLQRWQQQPQENPSAEHIREARKLARRLLVFFQRVGSSPITTFPKFRGCGWLDGCVADAIAERTIFEVKAGDRRFRASDLRQVLIYCALDLSERTWAINQLCLVNPRLGVFFHEPIDRACEGLAGRSAGDVLGDIVEYISDPIARYPGM